MSRAKAAEFARRVLGNDPTRRFTPEEDREHLRLTLEDRGVSTEIIDRVMRLNPVLVEGQILRGLYQKRFSEPKPWFGVIGKGEFLARFGRDAFASLDRRDITKRGRRVYVTRRACERFRMAVSV